MNSIDVWNDLGNLYLKGNAINAAVDAYNKALDQGYQTAEIYNNLAGAYASQGNMNDSIPLYQKSIELLSDQKEKALVYTRLGDCYRRLADFDNAIAAFKTAIDIEPGNPALCVGLGEVQRDLEKLCGFDQEAETLASEEFQPLNAGETTSSSSFPGELLEVPEELTEETNLSSVAIDDLPAALGLDHSQVSAEMPVEAGDISEQIEAPLSNDFVSEVNEEVSVACITDDSQNLDGGDSREKAEGVRVTLLLTMGIMHWRNGNLEEADSILQSAIDGSVKIKNNWFEALSWHALALVKTALGDIEAAIHAYLQAVELAPDQISPWNNLGNLYGHLGCNDNAMAAFQKAIRQYPEDSTSWDGLGDIYTKLGRLEDAIAAYQLGNVFEKKAQGEDAITAYEKAFDFYHFTISSFEDEISRTQDDLEHLQAAEAFEADVQPLEDLGIAEPSPEILAASTPEMIDLDGGDPDDENFEASAPFEPVVAENIAESGSCQQIDEAEAGLTSFQDSMDEEIATSDGTVAEFGLPGDDEEGISLQSAQPAVEEMTVEPEISVEPAIALEDESLPPIISEEPVPVLDPEGIAGKIASYEAVVRENPKNDRAWDKLGNYYRITQRNGEAIHALQQAIALEPEKYVYYYQLGSLLAAEGKYEEAIGAIQKVIDLNPSFNFAHCALASYLRKMGRDDEAQEHIAIALPHMENEKEYDRACFESICGNIDKTLELLSIALEKKQTTLEFIRRDQDLDFVRQDSRYKIFETRFSQSVVEY